MKKFRLISFFTGLYEDSSLQIRKKSRILASFGLWFGAISLAFSILMALTQAFTVAVVFIGIAVFCAAVLILLKRGRYNIASSLFLYGLFLAMFVAIKFDAYADVYETYVFGTLGCFILIVTTLVADRPRQAVVIGILNLAAIEALYWLDAYPVDGNTVTLLAIQNLAVSSLMVAISTVASAALVRMTGSLIAEVQKRADESASSYGNLSTAMNEAQASSQQIGEMLSASVIRTVHAVESLRERAVEISGGMDDLRLALSQSSEENKTAVQKQGKVKEALTAYSDEVARASSAIEEMAAAAGSISLQASQKSEAVRGLVSLSTAGENLLASMNHSINQILDSAKRMMETSVFIGDVAERTNLLGMNASIEAAHAGAAGKGFAVVADQIRGLSVEASKSSRLISDTLKETQASVEAAAGKNGEALSFFKKISEEIRGVSLMIEELLASIKELSAGSADVLKAVEAVADLTRKTDAVVDASCESISRSSEGIESVVKLASRVREEAAEMAGNFDQMKKDAEEVKLLGGENLSTIQSLKKSLDGFAPAGGGLKGLASQ